MDLRKLTYFCAIVNHGSISAAAKFLNISQPPLSMHLKELEEEVGKTLFIRKKTGLVLSPEGHLFYTKATQLLKRFDEFDYEIKSKSLFTDDRRLTIAIISSTVYILKDLMLNASLHGNIEVMVNSQEEIERALQERKVDFAIVCKPLMYDNYEITELGTSRYLAAYSPTVPAPDKEIITVHDLANVNLLLPKRWLGKKTRVNSHFRNAFYNAGLTPNVILETGEYDLLYNMIKEGVNAVSFFPEFFLRRNYAENIQVRQFEPELLFHLVVVHKKDVYLTEYAQAVLDWIKEQGAAASCALRNEPASADNA